MRGDLITLAQVLGGATAQVWPKRVQSEALFDLPERKRWTPRDRLSAIEGCATWLIENGVVAQPTVAVRPPTPLSLADARARVGLLAAAHPTGPTLGVARDLHRIAPLVGSAPKTLANALGRFAAPRRLDHRWLLALARLTDQPAPLGLCFEDRSQGAVVGLMERVAGHAAIGQVDALDALLLVSLIALWQRRRPTGAARGNRAQASTRRAAPKPISRLVDSLVLPEQALVLLSVRSAGVRALAMEAALTRAHLAPHADRRGATPGPPRLLPAIAQAVTGDSPRDTMLRFRIAVMQAWRSQGAWPDVAPALAAHPYAVMTAALARQAHGGRLMTADLMDGWDRDWAGKAMLAPIIRHRMHRREEDGERGRVLRALDQ